MTRVAKRLPRGPLFNIALVSVSAVVWIVVGATALSHFPSSYRALPGSVEAATDDIIDLVVLLEQVSPQSRDLVVEAFSNQVRYARLDDQFPEQSDTDESLVQVLRNARPGSLLSAREMQYRRLTYSDLVFELSDENRRKLYAVSANEVSVRLSDGQVLVLWISPLGMLGRWATPLIGITLFLLLVFSGVSTLGFRYALTNLRALEVSALDFKPGAGVSVIEETGPAEIRRLTKALNMMQQRVDQLTRERSFLVAGVAHDIRTNITRMRLRVDQMRSPKKAALEADIHQTEQLLDDLMVYARADRHDGVDELIDLGELVASLAEQQAFDLPLCGCQEGFVVAADRAALERALSNLISNAWKYGKAARIRCELGAEGYSINVEDDGPGIPPNHLANVLDPFYRVEPSRNPETGGTGLGLTIARDLLTAQGATLRLENRDEGGLRALVHFPSECRID